MSMALSFPGSAGGSPAGDGRLAGATLTEKTHRLMTLWQGQTRLFGRAAQTHRRAACAPRRVA